MAVKVQKFCPCCGSEMKLSIYVCPTCGTWLKTDVLEDIEKTCVEASSR
jgi:predicted amidophosphoribosyltransferase